MAESLADIANTLEQDEIEQPAILHQDGDMSGDKVENNKVPVDICEIQPSTSHVDEDGQPPILVGLLLGFCVELTKSITKSL